MYLYSLAVPGPGSLLCKRVIVNLQLGPKSLGQACCVRGDCELQLGSLWAR